MEKKSEITQVVNLLGDDDDDDDGGGGIVQFTPISDRGTTRKTSISVESYSQERDLNLAIMASLKSNAKLQSTFVDLSLFNDEDDDDDDIRMLNFRPKTAVLRKRRRGERFGDSRAEKGESSNSKNDPDFICEICVEPMSKNGSFSIKGCVHVYCKDCTAKYIASKLQENITDIRCPVSDCTGLLEPEYCRLILPKEVFDRWGDALCEAVILGSDKFYCPFKDCSTLLIDEGGGHIRESECPYCRRLFCARCKVPWHSGIDCEQFQKLHKDEREKEDIMLMKLAENKQWRRCPKCRIYVERTQGCRYMRCRCGTSFCYGCGSTDICTINHYCNHCRG